MRGEIIVETQEEFDAWMAELKNQNILTAFPDKDPAATKSRYNKSLQQQLL